ncbi:TPA: hypothetical protein N0F65_009442 [Lagenidium giganteum]|uniref:Uncharacterized protein n=1 Tax=Lagenidium giganteum TaxID=4803 RepID=A0AAV2ZDP4_9STRA|nr:TPA: hypothetical protein N0F65_009442 [Lagenidium giganteum]
MEESGPQAARSRRLLAHGATGFAGGGARHTTTTTTGVNDDVQQRAPVAVAPLIPPAVAHPVAPHEMPAVAATALTRELEVQVLRLTEEKEFLARYVQRLLNQLRQLLHKHGELDRLNALTEPPDGSGGGGGNEEDAAMAPWLTSSDFMNPLFQAYDVKIQEMEALVNENRAALNRIAARAESLAKENSALRQELEAAAEKAMLRQQHERTETSILNDEMLLSHETGDYVIDITERIDVLMAENNMLMEQVSLQDEELTSLRTDVADRDQQLVVMGQNFNHATIALQELRDSCEIIRNEKNHCENQVQRYAAMVAQLESHKEVMLEQQEALRAEHIKLEGQLADYEVMVNTVKKNADRKDESFSVRYQNVCHRLRELNSAIEAKERHIDEIEESNRSMKVELDAVRSDCEGMLAVMNSMEKQLSQYCSREDAVSEVRLRYPFVCTIQPNTHYLQLENDCKTKAEEVLLEKEQLSTREAQARREIARLLEKLRVETESHLRNKDEEVDSISRRYRTELSNREHEIKSLHSEVAQLRTKVDIVTRNQKDAEKQFEDACRRAQEASDLFEKKLRQIAERAAVAEESRDMANHSEIEYENNLRAKEDELIKLRTEYRDRCQELNERIGQLEREVDMRRTEAREAKEDAEEKMRKIQLLTDQLTKVKADFGLKISHEMETIHQQNRDLKDQLAHAEYKLGQARKEGASALEAYRMERERAEVRLIAEIESLKARMAALRDEKNRYERSTQEAEAKLSNQQIQMQQQARDLTDVKDLLAEREQASDESDRKVTELSSQLAAAISKHQQFYRQERELRAAVERLTLEKTRLERDATMCRKKLDQYRAEDYVLPSRRPTTVRHSALLEGGPTDSKDFHHDDQGDHFDDP